jgi:hypothetical protein
MISKVIMQVRARARTVLWGSRTRPEELITIRINWPKDAEFPIVALQRYDRRADFRGFDRLPVYDLEEVGDVSRAFEEVPIQGLKDVLDDVAPESVTVFEDIPENGIRSIFTKLKEENGGLV